MIYGCSLEMLTLGDVSKEFFHGTRTEQLWTDMRKAVGDV